MNHPAITLQLPDWLTEHVESHQGPLPDIESRMRLVIEFSRQNILHQTGGPFGAAIFDRSTHCLISAGVNVVVRSGLSIAHAEIMAISTAQHSLGTYDLGSGDLKKRYELVTSTEPCAMCFGALPWSGISSVACGATDADARAIGFDEGPRHPQWIEELSRRGIEVQTQVCRVEARQVLESYAASGGSIYNGRGD